MNSKNITIVKPGAGENALSEAYDITIQPGHTGKQVVEQLKLKGEYSLTKGDGKPVDMLADLFPLVENGEKLFATTPATVGRLAA
ncbi:MAG: hypothetical protein PHW60_03300 [Kiritimatiellae bacterium]|nr:hypothetical protein [Kiritimatiellia bacterium]